MDYEPRKADPGQEFTYTTNERRTLGEGEEPPAGVTVVTDTDDEGNVTRRSYVAEGVQRTIRADDDGVIWPKTEADVRALDLYNLPVARKAEAAKKADKAEAAKE